MKICDVCSRKSANGVFVHNFRITAASTEHGVNWVMNRTIDVCKDCAEKIIPTIENAIAELSKVQP